MVFTVLAAVDLSGKLNFELTFPTLPTISELRSRIDDVMAREAALRRPPQAGPFRIHRIQVFDERMEMWVDLVASSQLEDYCQCYVFQKESPWHKDTPGRIPPPVRPAEGHHYTRSSSPPAYIDHAAPLYSDLQFRDGSASPYGSPAAARYEGSHSPQHAGPGGEEPNVARSEMVRAVYDELDVRKSRQVALSDWQQAFERLRLVGDDDVRLTSATVDDLFQKKADRNEDGILTFPEFQHFGEMYPKLVESMYFRSRRVAQENLRKDRLRSQHDQLADAERRLDDARQQALEAESEGMAAREKADDLDSQIEQARAAEQAAADEKRARHEDTEQQRQRVREAKAAEMHAKEEVKKREAAKRAAQRGAEGAAKKAQAQEQEMAKLQRELDALLKRVADKEREIQRQQEAIDAARGEAADAQIRAEEAADPALEDAVREAQDNVRLQEEELKHIAAAENDRAAAHREAQREVSKLQQQRQQLDKETQGAKVKEQQRRATEQRAEKAVDDLRKAVERNEEREVQEEAKRDEQEQKENELLQMEVRLREQREAVEKKEEHLRTAHRDFSQEAGRGSSPQRGLRYD